MRHVSVFPENSFHISSLGVFSVLGRYCHQVKEVLSIYNWIRVIIVNVKFWLRLLPPTSFTSCSYCDSHVFSSLTSLGEGGVDEVTQLHTSVINHNPYMYIYFLYIDCFRLLILWVRLTFSYLLSFTKFIFVKHLA